MSEVEKELGKQVARARTQAGLTQEKLASRVRVAQETISRLETGRAIPSLKRLEDIAKAVNVRLADLFTFEPPPPAKPATARDRMLEGLVKELRDRSVEEIEMVRKIARQVFARRPNKKKG